jgi:hypothetical protein
MLMYYKYVIKKFHILKDIVILLGKQITMHVNIAYSMSILSEIEINYFVV